MNSDEDPSFAFICEGSSAVLGIFGESTSGLADMSASSGVAELEAVFAKAAASLPAQSTPPGGADKKLSANNDILSDFQVNTTALASAEEPNKDMQVLEPSVLEGSVGPTEEVQEGLDPNPTLPTGGAVVPEGSSKNEPSCALPATVAGSVELAEEIMEVFANTKTVLDSENVVAKLEGGQEELINDPCSLQEELDSLEQLAMERVREIEGELVNSTKQIAGSNLSEVKHSGLGEEPPKLNVEATALAKTVVESDSIHSDGVGDGKDSINEDRVSAENIAVIDIDETVAEEKSKKSVAAVETSESLKDVTVVQESISSDLLGITKNRELTSESSVERNKHVGEIYEFKAPRESSSDKSRVDEGGEDVLNSATETESQKLCESENRDTKNVSNAEKTSDLIQGNENAPSNDSKKVYEKTDINSAQLPLTESETENTASVVGEQPTKQIEDIQSYETEDDDLEVLEAFIVKSATNPELAMCATNTKDNATEKYSLESSLLDDLTKTDNDNGSGTNDVVESLTDVTNSLKQSPPTDSPTREVTPQDRLSQALERASQKIASVLSGVESHSKEKGDMRRRPVKQNVSLSNDKQLPLKKRLAQMDSEVEEAVSGTASGLRAVKDQENVAKKVIVEVVVKRRGRPPGTGKKQLAERKAIAMKVKEQSDQGDSQSPGVEKSSQNQSSAKSAKAREMEDSVATDAKIKALSVVARKSTTSQKTQEKISNVPSNSKQLARREKQTPERSLPSAEATMKERKKAKETSKRKRDGSEIKEEANEKRRKGSSPGPSALKNSGREKRKIKEDESKTLSKRIDEGSDARKATSSAQGSSATRNTLKSDANVQKLTSLKPQAHEKHASEKHSLKSNSVSDVTVTLSRKVRESRENPTPVRSPVNVKSYDKNPEPNVLKSCKNVKREEKIQKTASKCARDGKSKNIVNITKEQELQTHNVPRSMMERVGNMMDVYSDLPFVQFENITFDMLRSEAKRLVLPSPLWGVHISKEQDLVIFSRVCAQLSDDKPLIDKALVFQGSLKPVALIMNEPADLPIPCIRTFEDLVLLIRNFHSVSFCEGTGIKQRPQSKSCFKYLDVANPGSRCSQCLEERRRVLFGYARKLKERIRLLRAGTNL